MNTRVREIVQKILATLIVIVIMTANLSMIGIEVISYAIDMVATNSGNVEFYAYFMNEENEQVTSIEKDINTNDLKVYIEVAVKNEGYFNGKISLEDTSFKLNGKYNGEAVKKINDNTIELNQINAGTTAKIEVGLNYNYEENTKLELLGKDNKIGLTGIYKSSKKDTDIKGETNLNVNWKSPENINAKIGAKILTNKVYEIDGVNKKVVQVLVNSKIENDVYPIKNTKINLRVPSGAEQIKVHARGADATNSNIEINENSYNYNADTGILTIDLENTEKDGIIKWSKDKVDTLVATYIYPEDIELENPEINVNNIINTYDDREISSQCTAVINEEINGIVTSYLSEDETSIYKGKIYTGENRYYTTSTVLNIDFAKATKDIKLKENEAIFTTDEEELKSKIKYVQSRISKSDFDRIFGETGYITIIDQDKNTIANINKESEVDENGYINISYNDNVTSIGIITSIPQIEGTLKIYHRKSIGKSEYDREVIREITDVKETVYNNYNTNVNEARIQLKETESQANIKVNADTLSTIETNKNVEIVATLNTDDEGKDLYKNPTVDIIFPSEITGVKVLSAKALYRNGLKVSKYNQEKDENGNIIIHIEFEGEQKKYDNLNGTEIHLYADITANKLTPSKDITLKMNYTNENGIKEKYETSTVTNLKSKDGLALYNSISNYNDKGEKIEGINEKESAVKLDLNGASKTAMVTTALINNYTSKIQDDVVVIGKIPDENKENTFSCNISNLKVNNDAKIYYNSNVDAKENDKGWTTSDKNAKAYKVVLNDVEPRKVVKITYNVGIPSKLTYNEEGNLTTSINYNYSNRNLSASTNVVLETEKATIKEAVKGTNTTIAEGLDVNISATVGNKELAEGDSVYEGETIRYTIKITNNSGKDYKDVKVKATQTNGNIFDLVETPAYNPAIYDETRMGNRTCMGRNRNKYKRL